jgi:hypothetical protein
MFPVEISIIDEDALAERMTTMRQWLDHQRFEPLTFRYSFAASAIRFRVDFANEGEAVAFDSAFDGKIVAH